MHYGCHNLYKHFIRIDPCLLDLVFVFKKKFLTADDHKVSQQEFVSRFAHNEPELNIIAQGLFYEFDMNRDGFVTVSDLDLYYQKIDTNGKNFLFSYCLS